MLDHASLAYHAQGADRHDEVPAIARRGATRYLEKGLTFSALRLAAEGLAEAPNDPELLAVATEAAWRLDFLGEALTTRDIGCGAFFRTLSVRSAIPSSISRISSRMEIRASQKRSSSDLSSLSVGSIISVPATGNETVGAWKP